MKAGHHRGEGYTAGSLDVVVETGDFGTVAVEDTAGWSVFSLIDFLIECRRNKYHLVNQNLQNGYRLLDRAF